MKHYGFIYDKQGNARQVSAPVRFKGNKLIPVKKPATTATGRIPNNVGFSSIHML